MNKKQIMETFKNRLLKNIERHPNLDIEDFLLNISDEVINIIEVMEMNQGEPDVLEMTDGTYFLVDSFTESPDNRRSVCYDESARTLRKKFPPKQSAWGMIEGWSDSLQLMNEEVYYALQSTGTYDVKSEVWLDTPIAFRKKGDGLFGRKRHHRTFVYFNGVQSYYKTRGFRMMYKLK